MASARESRLALNWASLVTAAAFLVPWVLLVNQLRYFWTVDDQYAYGWSVPFLAVFLFYRRWQERPAADAGILAGRALVLLAALLFLPLLLIQEATPDWSAINWALALATLAFSLGVGGCIGGKPWLVWFVFPCAFLLTSVPWPHRFELSVTNFLMHHVASLTAELLNWVDIAALQQGNRIRLPNGLLEIDEACSGVRSLQSLLMVSLFLGELYRFSWKKRGTLAVAGLAFALLGNLVRSFALGMIGAREGISAIGRWHDPAGFTIMAFAMVATWLTASRMRNPNASVSSEPSPSVFHLPPRPLPLWAAVALCIWFPVTRTAVDFWYRSHETRSQRWDWTVCWPKDRKAYREIPLRDSMRTELLCSDSYNAGWIENDGASWALYWLRWNPGRTSTQSARQHRPDTCLQASGATMTGDLGTYRIRAGELEFPFHAYTFLKDGATLYVFFCIYEQNNSDSDSSLLQDWSPKSRIQRVLTGQRNLGQQSLEFAMTGYPTEYDAAKALARRLSGIVKPVANGSN